MELRQLKYFLVTAETLHFSRAAEVLYMSQPALSKQIAELEKELGVTLFVRDKRGVQITPAGLRLQEEARKLLHQAEQLRPLIQNLPDSGVSRHSLFVGVDSKAMAEPSFRRILTETIYTIRQQHPGLDTTLQQFEYDALQNKLLSDELDIAFSLDSPAAFDGRFDSLTLWKEEMILVIRDSQLYQENDISFLLTNQKLLLLENENRGLDQILRILSDLHVVADIRFCQNRSTMTLSMECGEGITILPLSVIKKLENPQLQVFHLPSPNVTMHMMAVSRKGCSNLYRPELIEQLLRYTAALHPS